MKRLFPLLLLAASPAMADELSALQQSGRATFEENCAICHREDATGAGEKGSDIRGVPLLRVMRAIKGVDEMPEIVLTTEEAEAIAAWLRLLGED